MTGQSNSRSPAPRAVLPADAASLHRRIEALAGFRVKLKLNDNTSTLISVQHPKNAPNPVVSLHHMFLNAPDNVLQALAQYIQKPTIAANSVLRKFIDGNMCCVRIRPPGSRSTYLRPRGRVHDLRALASEVNDRCFGGEITARITWGRRGRSKGTRRHIIFGSFDHRSNLIRIHPLLDSEGVPEFFVCFVIFHEMLHAFLDPQHDADEPRRFHTPEFRRREKLHPDFKRSAAFEQEFFRNLG